jgi:hypothetical protein
MTRVLESRNPPNLHALDKRCITTTEASGWGLRLINIPKSNCQTCSDVFLVSYSILHPGYDDKVHVVFLLRPRHAFQFQPMNPIPVKGRNRSGLGVSSER